MKPPMAKWLGLFVFFCGCLVSHASCAVESAAATIVSLQGSGQVRPENVQQWRAASVNQGLFPGNYVRTGDLSRMALLFIDQTQLSLGQNSQLQIKQVQDPKKALDTTVRLNRGRSWTQSKQISRHLTMETPSATAAIRGTDWEMEVDESGRSTLTVLSGEVDFYNDQGRVVVRRNEQAIAEIGKSPVKLIITSPRDRVQWVSAYNVETLRHIYLHDSSIERLRRALENATGGDPQGKASRGSILADLGQWDKAEQPFREALAAQPENATALLGMGYLALHRGKLEQAETFFARVPVTGHAELLTLGRAAAAIQAENFKAGRDLLQEMIVLPDLRQAAAYLMLSDLMLYSGAPAQALDYLDQARRRFPDDARVASQAARAHLFADQQEDSRRQVREALRQNPSSVDAYLAMGALARQQGDAREAESAYLAAIAAKPEDDRGWYGLGTVNSEKEEIRAGRAHLNRALSLNPAGAGYRGELATLETFANNLDAAEAGYRKALEDNPGDYVALTGRGLLQLKRGHTGEALESFLKASVIEPRYARAHMYTAVAYYQLGRTARALEELTRAKELDARDPFPYMLASMIHGDHFESREAIHEGREALRRMPYLKSLNQIANDQKGTANLGNALAFFGMEEWAFNHAQESYNPFWGGSHLFLAERYPNRFNKNSELFQGYLVDPTAFGGSNRFQTLLPRPGNYFSTGLRVSHQDDLKGEQPYVTANGYANSSFPLAYFLDAAYAQVRPGTSQISADSTNLTAALGANPVHELGLFGFATRTDTDGKLAAYPVKYVSDRVDLGGHYKLSPTSQLWMKLGKGKEETHLDSHVPEGSMRYDARTDTQEFQMRHLFFLGQAAEVSWGLESASLETPQYLSITLRDYPDNPVTNSVTSKNDSRDAYLSGRFRIADNALLQADLHYQRYTKKENSSLGWVGYPETFDESHREHTQSDINRRLGLVYRWGGNRQLVRMAYQEWTRPASVSTLSSVTTAGIVLDDQLVSAGGHIARTKVQVENEWSPDTFTTLFVDNRTVKNGPVAGIQSSYLDGLDKLKVGGLINAASVDMMEGTPLFDQGKAMSAGIALNHILNPAWSVYSRYVYTDSEITGDQRVEGFPIPYLPRHTFILGSTWTGPRRLFVNVLGIWRGQRFATVDREERLDSPGTYDDRSLKLLPGWNAGIRAYWESQDKRWSFDGVVANVFSRNVSTYYGIDAKYRF